MNNHMDVLRLEDGGIIIHMKYEENPGESVRLHETQKNLLLITLLQEKGIDWMESARTNTWVGIEESVNGS